MIEKELHEFARAYQRLKENSQRSKLKTCDSHSLIQAPKNAFQLEEFNAKG